MRVTFDARAAHGAALLQAAGRLFRGRGIEAVRVADVSAAVGLTHGAFYGHFASKAALAEVACGQSLRDAAARWRSRATRAWAEGRDPLHAIIDAYLTEQHRDAPEQGCWLGALGSEVARAGPALRAELGAGTALLQDVLAELIAIRHAGWPAERVQDAASAVLAALVGGLVLSRASAADPARSRAALASAAALARRAAEPPPGEPPLGEHLTET